MKASAPILPFPSLNKRSKVACIFSAIAMVGEKQAV